MPKQCYRDTSNTLCELKLYYATIEKVCFLVFPYVTILLTEDKCFKFILSNPDNWIMFGLILYSFPTLIMSMTS